MSEPTTTAEIPCGKTMGHGLRCEKDYLCDSCAYIKRLVDRLGEAEKLLNAEMESNHRAAERELKAEAIIKAISGLLAESPFEGTVMQFADGSKAIPAEAIQALIGEDDV